MFSLIITIISIALVVALVAATMYSGGDTLTNGRTSADAAAFVTGAQQISGAQVMHLSLEGKVATTVSGGAAGTDLVLDKYLASAPVVKADAAGVWALDTALKLVTNTVATDPVCTQINKTAGVAAAKQSSAVAADFAGLPYGCVSATRTFQFKY
ncbi:hypothetical protein WJ96_05160 [Burkholderia ubonensis]|uniref:Type 4 secretion system PilS N-terminal domain-containing protein n=1 Tax=Burkholderia ubonensis TaxID=101571 RepID=A0AAW3MVZ8_9BURK|nr:hypothetical protein [Burkholderia ubonensis]KVP75152.1 hypothetical protein WJ93_06980 [Burkholderia ubonensis]KVP96615.1 hypothetical protein WJ97_12080 [Burkholderia ubonensis]KVP97960.1 hypothetical protein WJ96_05160 [Burkholderia ubonensis]KVZ92657.1 hypothetical protein WL25_16815 [Burkholderia ubonensis]